MRIKLFVLLVLGVLASGTAVWAANETAQARSYSSCCGFCVPDEPCCGFCR